MGDKILRVSCIKFKHDLESFRFFKGMGIEVYELEDPEQTDVKIHELVENHCNTIFLSNEIAGFSEDIIKKYQKNEYVNIIIAPSKRIGRK